MYITITIERATNTIANTTNTTTTDQEENASLAAERIVNNRITRKMNIHCKDNAGALRAMRAVDTHVEALQRAKLTATVDIYSGKEHTCGACAGENIYGGFCTCLSLEDRWIATWTSNGGWTEGWEMIRAHYGA